MPGFASGRAWSSAQNLGNLLSKDAGSAQKKAAIGKRKEKASGMMVEATSGDSVIRKPLPLETSGKARERKTRRLSVGLWLEEDLLLGEQQPLSSQLEKTSRPVLSRVRSFSTGLISADPLKQSRSLEPAAQGSSGGLLFDASIITEAVPEDEEMGCIECRQVLKGKKSKKQRKRTTASVSLQLGDLSDLCRSRSRSNSSASDREESTILRDGSPAVTPKGVHVTSSVGAAIEMSPRKKARVKKVSKATVSYGALPIKGQVSRENGTETVTKRRANSLTSTNNLKLTIRTPSLTSKKSSKSSKRCRHSRTASTAISPRKKTRASTVLESFLERRPSQDDLIEKNILVDTERLSGKTRAKNMLSHLLGKKRRKDLTSLGYQSSDEELLSVSKADKSQRRAEKLIDAIHQRGLLMDDEDLEIVSKIGEGAYSDVYLASYKGDLVAVKRLKTTKHTMKAFYRELDCLLRFGKHANVVTLKGVTLEPHKSLVLEYMPCGSLYSLLHEKAVKPSLSEALQLALDIATGMKEVHSGHVLHRDLTSRNVLYRNGRAVIADFGIARHESCKKGFPHTYSPIGHQRYRAPEVSNKEPYNSKADVYTFGTVLYELVTGKEAWEDIGDKQVAALQREGNTPLIGVEHDCPLALQKIVYKCWSFKPKTRPSFKELVKSLQELAHAETKRLASV